MSFFISWGAAVSLLWPLMFAAGAWAVAVWALNQHDPQSELVRRLTEVRPDSRPAGPTANSLQSSSRNRKETA